jgi:putative transposase
MFFPLYLVMDIYSRKIVGWEIHGNETADHAALLIRKACLGEGVHEAGLVLHSDNGSPMKGATMLASLQLGGCALLQPPLGERRQPLFGELVRNHEVHASLPVQAFESLTAAREWVEAFVRWYNHEDHHSGIQFVIPAARHSGEELAILAERSAVYEAAKERNPQHWSGAIRNWKPVGTVWLNPENPETDNPGIRDMTA